MYKEDTIAAVATASGEGAVAIVRISGHDAEQIAKRIFSRNGTANGVLRSHMLYHGTVSDPATGAVLDEVLLTIMRKPHSYTGEDVVEVQCHGGVFLARRILELILSQGARQAEPGEFTKRAFLNSRLDLAQAEAVLDLIHARTDKGACLALGQVRGKISNYIHDLREQLLDVLVQVEAAIDFPEEEIELLRREQLTEKVTALMKKISKLIDSYDWGRLFREGATVCIAGKPNVGKSSLLNALLGEERVIVTPTPGTTRDVIEEGINLDGIPVVLWDTAGIHDSEDQIERLGVGISRNRLAEADTALVVVDGSAALTAEDRSVMAAVKGKSTLVVVNKKDLPQMIDNEEFGKLTHDITVVPVSAKEGTGIDSLKQALRHTLLRVDPEPETVVSNIRHKASLERTANALAAAVRALEDRMPPDIVAVELQAAGSCLAEIIGTVDAEDILERIFVNFCIGK